MRNILKYIIYKEYKLFTLTFAVFMGLFALIDFEILPETLLGFNYISALIAITMLVCIGLLTERLYSYVEKGITSDNREYLLLIPHTPSQIILSVVLLLAGEILIFILGLSLFEPPTLRGFSYGFLYTFLTLTAMPLIAIYVTQFANKFTKKTTTSYLLIFLLAMVITIGLVILSTYTTLRIPFLFSYSIAYVALCTFLFSLAHFGISKSNTYSKENNAYVYVSLAVLLLSVAVYGFGQYNTYSDRRIDDVSYTFEDDTKVQGEWDLVGIDTSSQSSSSVDISNLDSIEYYTDAYEVLNILPDGDIDAELQWTKNFIINTDLKVNQHYTIIKDDHGEEFLIVEWKDKDYVYRNGNPFYHVYSKS